MKKIVFILLMIIGFKVSQAQIVVFKATTGDVEMNNFLIDIHNHAIKDMVWFKGHVINSFHISHTSLNLALKVMSPGDVFMAAQLSFSIGRPFEEVIKIYQGKKSSGWGVIAKDLGIKPGSPEFHAMKKSMKSHGGEPNKGGQPNKAPSNNSKPGKGNGNHGHGKK